MLQYFKMISVTVIALAMLSACQLIRGDNYLSRSYLKSLECYAIPNVRDKICVDVKDSVHGPYDFIKVFRKSSTSRYTEIAKTEDGCCATYGGFGFSKGGKLMWEAWAEEGHPSFRFFKTKDFLQNGYDAKAVGYLDPYGFDGIHKFTDQGYIEYSLWDGAPGCSVDIRKTKDEQALCIQKHQLKIK